MVLRSDELANQEQVERDQSFRGNIKKGVATAASLGTAAVAGPLAARVMPFLNQYIPTGLAIQGINKVSPKLGSFLKKGQDMGLDVEEGLNFIKEKMGSSKTEPAKESRSILEQYSPELHAFIKEKIGKGVSPVQAATEAMNNKKFMNVIKKITQDHKTPWSSIVESIFGKGKGMDGSTIMDAVRGFQQEGQQQQSPQEMQQQAQQPQQGDPQIKQRLLQTMQALTQQLRS